MLYFNPDYYKKFWFDINSSSEELLSKLDLLEKKYKSRLFFFKRVAILDAMKVFSGEWSIYDYKVFLIKQYLTFGKYKESFELISSFSPDFFISNEKDGLIFSNLYVVFIFIALNYWMSLSNDNLENNKDIFENVLISPISIMSDFIDNDEKLSKSDLKKDLDNFLEFVFDLSYLNLNEKWKYIYVDKSWNILDEKNIIKWWYIPHFFLLENYKKERSSYFSIRKIIYIFLFVFYKIILVLLLLVSGFIISAFWSAIGLLLEYSSKWGSDKFLKFVDKVVDLIQDIITYLVNKIVLFLLNTIIFKSIISDINIFPEKIRSLYKNSGNWDVK